MAAKKGTADERAEVALRAVNQALNAEIAKIKTKTMAGLVELGLLTEAAAKKRVPREHGLLFASIYSQKAPESTQDEPAVEVGSSSDYAVYVHENLEAKLRGKPRPSGLGVYWGPDGEPRFLVKAVEEVTPKVDEVMMKHAEIKDRKA